jgi:hypothetical protein
LSTEPAKTLRIIKVLMQNNFCACNIKAVQFVA